MEVSISEALRLSQVKRYPICHTGRDQNVAEHSYNVMLIATRLVGEDNPALAREVVMYALTHDMDEVFTGDIPSSFKRRLRAECPAVIPVLDGAPKASPKVRLIVKVADLIEAIYFLDEFGGSRWSDEVRYDIWENFWNLVESEELTGVVGSDIVARAKDIAGELFDEDSGVPQ